MLLSGCFMTGKKQREGILLDKYGRKLIIGAAAMAVFVFASSAVDRLWDRLTGSPRLISVDEIPESMQCYRPVRLDSSERNLFSEFGEAAVEAQDAGPV